MGANSSRKIGGCELLENYSDVLRVGLDFLVNYSDVLRARVDILENHSDVLRLGRDFLENDRLLSNHRLEMVPRASFW